MGKRPAEFAVFDEWTERLCELCGERKRLAEFASDSTQRLGVRSCCRACDKARSRAYYWEHRERVLAKAAAKRAAVPPALRVCSECGTDIEPPKRVVCSSLCGEARFKRLNPEAYAAREARKVERRRERRREQRGAS